MLCYKCGNTSDFRHNETQKTVACRVCNNLVRSKNTFYYKGVDEVQWFSHWMLEKLNTPRGQARPEWEQSGADRLLLMLQHSVKNIEREIKNQNGIIDIQALLGECCNAANFAMLIADNSIPVKTRNYLGE